MLPILIKLRLNEGITCPVHGKSYGRWFSANILVTTEHFTWLVAVPTCTLGATELNFWIGASLAK